MMMILLETQARRKPIFLEVVNGWTSRNALALAHGHRLGGVNPPGDAPSRTCGFGYISRWETSWNWNDRRRILMHTEVNQIIFNSNVNWYDSIRKVFCDLELWTRNLQNVTSVMWIWKWVIVASFIEIWPHTPVRKQVNNASKNAYQVFDHIWFHCGLDVRTQKNLNS